MREPEVKLLRIYNNLDIVIKACRLSGVPNSISDEKLIEIIVENDYSSVLEHIVFTFEITCSNAIARELLEHRIASHTAFSTRYKMVEDYVYPFKNEEVRRIIENILNDYKKVQEKKEIKRYMLPFASSYKVIWTINARSLINFLGLRLCARASPEIQILARKILKICRKVLPEIFNRIECRGYNLGVCPENEARPKNCYHPEIPTKKEIKKKWFKMSKSLLEKQIGL